MPAGPLPDEQTEKDDEISDQLKEDDGSRYDVAIMPQIASGFGQNRGIVFLAEGSAAANSKRCQKTHGFWA